MILLSRLEPVTSEEVAVGNKYVLLSEAQEQLYMLTDGDVKFISIFGRPVKYGLYACVVEEVDQPPITDKSVPFYSCKTDGMFKYRTHSTKPCDLSIDWAI